jgi:glyoxylase-like metal-dependent hydrolase (beta-lactamase superfamily II)
MPRAYSLAPGIRLSPVRTPTLPPATTTNCYIVGSDELIVIDPASPYDSERAALDEGLAELQAGGRKIVEIWLTHHHGDHVGGAAYLAERLGVPIAAHRHTAELLDGRVAITRHLEDGECYELSGPTPRRLRVIHTPGHAPGHICVLEERSGFLIAGDMVAGVGTIVIEPTEGDMHLYLQSLRRMQELAPRVLLPAHGSAITAPQAKLAGYIKHRLWREQRVVDAMQKLGTTTARALVPEAYADVPPMVYPLAERSLIAHLHKLERDRRAARDESQPPLWQLIQS